METAQSLSPDGSASSGNLKDDSVNSTAFVQGQRPASGSGPGEVSSDHTAGGVQAAAGTQPSPAAPSGPMATCTNHIPRSLSSDVFATARQMVRTYAGGLGGKTGPSESLALGLFNLLAQHKGEDLFALKHAVEAAVPYTDPAWTACSLLAIGSNHVLPDAVAAFRALQRRELQALAPRARARVASVALLFDVDDTLTPALQDTSFPSVQAYPGLRAVVRRLAMRCAETGHLLRVGCLTARPGWLAWAVVSALRTAFHMPALVPEKHGTRKGHTLPVSEEQHRNMSEIAAADITDGLAGDGRHAGLGSCDLLTGRLRDSLRIRSNSRNSAIAHTKSMNFQAFARMHPECVVIFCGDSGQGDAITALQMQREALVSVQWDVSTPKAAVTPLPSASPAAEADSSAPSAAASSDSPPAVLTPDAEMMQAAAAAASARISRTCPTGHSNWMCYACCGVIHDIVGIGSSGKQIPGTSALKRARQRAKGVHIFDSYVEVAGVLGVLLPLLLAPRPGTGEPVWRTVDTDAVALAAVRDMHVPADSVIKHSHKHGAVTVGHLWAKDARSAGTAAALDALHASTNLASPLPVLRAPQESAAPADTASASGAIPSALSAVTASSDGSAGNTGSTATHPTPAQLRVMRDLFNDPSISPQGGHSPVGARRTHSFEGGTHSHLEGGGLASIHDDSTLGTKPRAVMLRTHSDGPMGCSAPPGAPVFAAATSADEAEARSLHTELQRNAANSGAVGNEAMSPSSTLAGDLPPGIAVALPPPTAVSGIGASPAAVMVQHEAACSPSGNDSPLPCLHSAATNFEAPDAVSPVVPQHAVRPPPISVGFVPRREGGAAGTPATLRTHSGGSTLTRGTSFGDRLRQGVPDAVLQEVYSWAKAYPSISPFKFASKVQGDHRLQELRVAMDTWCSWGGAGAHCSGVALHEHDADGNSSAWVAPPPARAASVSALLQLQGPGTPVSTHTAATPAGGILSPEHVPLRVSAASLNSAEEGIDVPSTRSTAKAITGPVVRAAT